eukprot:TRINITY_DN17367_c0_g1_i1.p1 TRINITY_DN17367_c0_g1~~TRINITY_DN17367_c0_g1_i1.p1  ORF type:complete len:195 (-),score=55.00 TRINITY_DN17367_c0_g1_i1:764-1348(-)
MFQFPGNSETTTRMTWSDLMLHADQKDEVVASGPPRVFGANKKSFCDAFNDALLYESTGDNSDSDNEEIQKCEKKDVEASAAAPLLWSATDVAAKQAFAARIFDIQPASTSSPMGSPMRSRMSREGPWMGRKQISFGSETQLQLEPGQPLPFPNLLMSSRSPSHSVSTSPTKRRQAAGGGQRTLPRELLPSFAF